MPVKAAGWRIDPPVSVPVTPGAIRAATARVDEPLAFMGQASAGKGFSPRALMECLRGRDTVTATAQPGTEDNA